MPTYEYECETCHRVFEEFQSITAPALTKCTFEGCDGTVKRLFSAGGGFILKGSGFYQTDYRSESYKKKASADTGSAGSTSAPAPAATAPSTSSTSTKST